MDAGGKLHLHLHLGGVRKQCRRRDRRYGSRGLAGRQRNIGERPAALKKRRRTGHWESDTVVAESIGESSDCILTVLERKTG